MIEEGSFFKNIPMVLAAEQRLLWEGAGWAISSISWAFERTKSLCSHIKDSSETVPPGIAQEIFVCCWSIIDQSHMLREILKRTDPPKNGPTDRFIERFEAATLIRNAMDHLQHNIKNIAGSTKLRPPLFGALSFCVVGKRHLVAQENGKTDLRGCRIVSLGAGAFIHPQHELRIAAPMGRPLEMPVSQFEFYAFEHSVNFSDLIAELSALVKHYDTVTKLERDEQLRKFARENGLDEEKIVSEHYPSNMLVAAEIEFLSDAVNQE